MSPSARLRLGVVGAGAMGALHSRVVAASTLTDLVWIAEPDRQRGQALASRFGATWMPQPGLADVDAVIVAAPTELHHSVALQVMEAGKPLLLEKPLADNLDHVTELVERARTYGTVLMCGLLERFNPAVRTAVEIARTPLHVATVRHSPYAERIRTGVAGDLLIHDVDLVLRLIEAPLLRASGRFGHFEPRSEPNCEDTVDAVLQFADGQIATLSASRVAQRKVRSLIITEIGRVIEVDLLRQDITVYRHVQANDFDEDAGYSQQTIIDIPVVRYLGEPLQLQLQHFVDLVDGRLDPSVELAGLVQPHAVIDQLTRAAEHDS